MRRGERESNSERYAIFIPQKRTKPQRETTTEKSRIRVADLNLKSFEAMRMRETFQQIYQAKTVADLEQLLNKWDNWVSQCNLPAMVETSKTIKNHWQDVVQWALYNGN